METIKKLWSDFVALTKSNVFIFGFPAIALSLLVAFPQRFLVFLFIGVWFVVIWSNTDED